MAYFIERFSRHLPESVKMIIRPLYRCLTATNLYKSTLRFISTVTVRGNSLPTVHEYWKNPSDGHNPPEAYLDHPERSRFLLSLLKPRLDVDAAILEIGCNIGRNLNYLFESGYHNLHGIEISENAVQSLRQYHAGMAERSTIYNLAIEDAIRKFEDDRFSLVYTMAVLEHIHPDSDWIFGEMCRITGNYIITIEDEYGTKTPRRFPRDYRKVFERLGMRQVSATVLSPAEGLSHNFIARVFEKRSP